MARTREIGETLNRTVEVSPSTISQSPKAKPIIINANSADNIPDPVNDQKRSSGPMISDEGTS